MDRAKRHDLLALVTIAPCGVICGAASWVEVARVGHAKRAWRETLLPLPNGLPWHDTVGRVCAALDPAACEGAVLGWMQAVVTAPDGAVVAMMARRCGAATTGPTAGTRSTWSVPGRPPTTSCSGFLATAAHSHEITAIPALLDPLTLDETGITSDAMGCQTAIAGPIVAGNGDAVLALTEHQGTLHELVQHHVAMTAVAARQRTVTTDHGRREIRTCRATEDPAVLAWLDPAGHWPGRRRIAAVTGERRSGETVTCETRSSLSSLPADPAQIGATVRAHGGIAHGLPGVLDLAVREDERRVRSGHAAKKRAARRTLALGLLRRATTAKVGITAKRLMCGWDEAYLATILTT